jgi:FAD/FMN-containing dehydrogenase
VNRLHQELADRLGPAAVLAGDQVATRSGGIWNEGAGLQADFHVRPADTQEVAFVLARCQATGQRVIVHGGLTGLVGATHSGRGDLVLSLERFNRIEAIDTVGRTLTAGAGVTLQAAQDAAVERDLLLPLDMGSRGSATLGGAASTNAGGNRVLRYGMTRSLVLGLEAVLADGTVISAMNRMLKNNAGFDLKHLFIGTEGTLGVITRLVWRLAPRPRSRQTAMVALDSFAGMHQLLHHLDAALGGTLSAFEALWQDYYRYVTSPATGRVAPVDASHPYFVLIEAEGGDPIADEPRFARVLETALEAGVIADAVIAQSQRERDALWALRDDVMRLTEYKPLFMFDVSVPHTAMESYVAAVRARLAASWPDAPMFTFGHLADGNLHFAISAGPADGAARDSIERCVYEPLETVGGSVSAEHGIGLEKKPYLHHSRSAAEIALMRTLKRSLDPANLLNPGRVFDL